jgi:hypothetical protein
VPLKSPNRYSRPICAAERVLQQVAEVALAERACEAMGDAEGAAELRYPQRRRQADQREVGLRRIDGAIARRCRRLVGLLRVGLLRSGESGSSGEQRRRGERCENVSCRQSGHVGLSC